MKIIKCGRCGCSRSDEDGTCDCSDLFGDAL